MLLAVDIGNTDTVLGVFDGSALKAQWRLSSGVRRTSDELWLAVRGLFSEAGLEPTAIHAAGIASVVPDLTADFETLVRERLHTAPAVVTGSMPLGIRIHYTDPSAVGADRLCNAVAGFRRYGGPLIVIDFGTATTYDVISAGGDYLGGVITLGVASVAAELHRRAAKLPRIELAFPPSVIGKDTTASMQAGVLYGAADAVEGMVRRIRQELGAPARAIATGGLAAVVAPYCPSIEGCEPSLVLEGIRLICCATTKGPA